MKPRLLMLAVLLSCVGLKVGAEVVTGTGLLQVQVTFAGDQQAIVRMYDDNLVAIGRVHLNNNGYGHGKMDAFQQPHGRVQAEWGRVEIALGCNQADVAVYQYVDDGEQLNVATTVLTERCE